MAAYFIDSSALVKRYVQEDGTSWVRLKTRRSTGNPIYVDDLALRILRPLSGPREWPRGMGG
jgi:predicted nucleic acid-binding protein